MNTEKVLKLAAKLLAIQEHRGATEAEAANAAEHLQRLLQEHNLTLSQIEAAGDQTAPTETRVKEAVKSYSSRSQQWRQCFVTRHREQQLLPHL